MPRKKLPAAEIVDVTPRVRTKRTPEIVEAIIEAVSSGTTLVDACKQQGIGVSTWYDWCEADAALSGRIARARVAGHDIIASDALRIVDEMPPQTMNGGTDSGFVAWQKNRVWARMQLLAKWDPKRYGEKIQAEHTGANGGPIQIISGIDRGDAAAD
jgi:hypothetical protein